MAINKITTEKELAIRRKSAASAPTRPSSMGMTASDVKAIFYGPMMDDTDSIKSEINRIVDEANADLNATTVAISGKVPTTRKVNGHALDGDINLTPADLGLVNAYQYRGSVDTYAELPASGMIAGDVYNVVAAHDNYPAGTNYAWNGTAWDPLGGEFDTSNLQVKTGWAQDSSDITIDYTMADNKTKSFSAAGIATVKLTIPSGVNIGYMAMVCIKHGSTAPTYTFVNNSSKPLTLVQFGVKVTEYVPSPNTRVRIMPACMDGETIEMLILEIDDDE